MNHFSMKILLLLLSVTLFSGVIYSQDGDIDQDSLALAEEIRRDSLELLGKSVPPQETQTEEVSQEEQSTPEETIVEETPVEQKKENVAHTVTGRVLDRGLDTPLAGAVVQSGSAQTKTDSDGRFTLTVPSGNAKLTVTVAKYNKQTVSLRNRSDVTIRLEKDLHRLDDMEVVAIGYGEQKKSDITGSVSSVDMNTLNKKQSFSIDKALQGSVSGVQITQNSGAPGKGFTVNIRGRGSINSSEPLYVVDGIPISDPATINPSDIKDITVLKDAASCAIYGSRGANGVILITTKSGEEGKTEFNYTYNLSASSPWKKPELLNAEEWAELKAEALKNSENLSDEDKETIKKLGKVSGEGTNWFNEVTRPNAVNQSHSASITKGSAAGNYFLSGTQKSQEGILQGSGQSVTGVRINASTQITDNVKLGTNTSFTHQKIQNTDESDEWNSLISSTLTAEPTTEVRDDKGNLQGSPYNQVKNPVGIIEYTNIEDKVNTIFGNFYTDVTFLEAITYRLNTGITYTYDEVHDFKPTYSISGTDGRNESLLIKSRNKSVGWNVDNNITYSTTFGDDHALKVMGGFSVEENTYESLSATRFRLFSNSTSAQWLDASLDPNNVEAYNSSEASAMVSLLTRINYDFANRYLFMASFRRDGSSKFGPNNRWGNFPAVSATWKISEEAFMERLEKISSLKLRLGWGQNGNQNIENYLFQTVANGGKKYPLGGKIQSGTILDGQGNPDIKWETRISTTAGLDLGLFDDRLQFFVEYYINRTKDMVLRVPLPHIVGHSEDFPKNTGEVENKGIDLNLSYKQDIKDFTMSYGLNFSHYKNVITKLDNQKKSFDDVDLHGIGNVVRVEEGLPIGSFVGRKAIGLFQSQREIDEYTARVNGRDVRVQPRAKPGDIKYADEDGDGEPDIVIIGNPHPDFTYGFNMDFGYKGFDLGIFFQGSYGNDIFNATLIDGLNSTAEKNLYKSKLGRWTGENSTDDPNMARMSADAGDNKLISDRYVEDGSYLRLKNLTLGYTLPESFAKRFRLTSLRVYLGVSNLFTLTKYSGLDPEIGQGEDDHWGTQNDYLDVGIDRGTYPQARTFSTGLNMTF